MRASECYAPGSVARAVPSTPDAVITHLNDEFWYDMRHDADLWDWIRNHYTFTPEQEQDLLDTLKADLEEMEDE